MEEKKLENERRGPVIGLTLQLQKFGVGKIRDKNDLRANTILGHYDHLVIREVRSWLEYSPRTDWESGDRQADIRSTNLLATHYPIKLLFPDETEIGQLPEFHYEEWKDHASLLEDNPCMTVVLLNLTDVYRERVSGSLLREFLRLLKNSCEPELLDEVHCCALPSLGYSDFCILMAGGDWKPALELVEQLHSLTVPADDGESRIPVLSTDYMMPVCHPKTGASWRKKFSKDYFEGIELTVRVNLCPGVTAQQLADRWENIQVYRISGGSDCLLWAKGEQTQELMSALIGDMKRNLVIDMASTPQLPLTPSGGKGDEPPESMRKDELTRGTGSFKKELRKFKKAIQRYAEELSRHNRHIRQASALWELSAIIEGVCEQPHAGLLRELMENLLDSFSSCLEQCAADMSQEDWDFSLMEEYVSQFTAIVGSFLEDLSRSDCFFMEREKYNHASVSSATSLLIVYNQWLNAFTDAVREATQEKNRSRYSFLVTCGGRDQTQTISAFFFLKPKIEGAKKDQLYEKLPLVIQMSEMSLFDFSGTILRSFHECMHYTGERRRRERLRCFLRFVLTLLSDQLARVLLDGGGYIQAAKVLERLNAPEALMDKAKSAYQKTLRKLSDQIAALLERYFPESAQKGWNEGDYLSINVQAWAYEVLFAAFSGYILDMEQGQKAELRLNWLAANMYDKILEAQEAYCRECDRLCREYGVSTVLFDCGARQLRELRQAAPNSCLVANETLIQQVQMALSRLLISELPEKVPMEENTEAFFQWNRKFPYFTLIYYNLHDILQGTTDIFSEAFADVAACTILEVRLEDYLLMHVYENWDLDSALCVDLSGSYRVPAVLRLCFGDCLEADGHRLSQEARIQMETAVARLEGHGMPAGRLNAQALCDRVDELLEAFALMEWTGAPLLEYLSLCRKDYQAPRVKKKMDRFSKAFQKIRLLAVDPEGADLHERLVEMHDALCGGWRDAHGRRDTV